MLLFRRPGCHNGSFAVRIRGRRYYFSIKKAGEGKRNSRASAHIGQTPAGDAVADRKAPLRRH